MPEKAKYNLRFDAYKTHRADARVDLSSSHRGDAHIDLPYANQKYYKNVKSTGLMQAGARF